MNHHKRIKQENPVPQIVAYGKGMHGSIEKLMLSLASKDPNPATVRSKARYARAAAIIPAVTLNEYYAACLQSILQRTGERKADLIRRLIAHEASPVVRPGHL